MTEFVHLHVHSEYSTLDGANKIDLLAKSVKNDKQYGIALTDHGNMHGALEHYNTCIQYGIKPIIGCEFYIAKGSMQRKHNTAKGYNHLTLLAKNYEGYKNLLYLTSMSFVSGTSFRPRIDLELLYKHAKGIVCLSGCLSGRINGLILEGKETEALELATTLKDVFGKDNFWLEIQRNGMNIQDKATEGMVRISAKTSIPLVATNDIHYLRHEDCDFQDTILCVNTGSFKSDQNRFKLDCDTLYFKTANEMAHTFRDLPQSLVNTLKIAKDVDLVIPQGIFHFPKSAYLNSKEVLASLTNQQLIKRNLVNETYSARLEYELQVINELGFTDYFLVVKDLVEYAFNKSIPIGPGRGSAAGCLVSYLLGVTNVDPIKHGLLFERFLNSSRKSLPDIDIDFCQEKRKIVIDYLKDKYGDDKVCSIVTFNRFGPKKAIRQVARVLEIPLKESDTIAKKMTGETIKESIAKDLSLPHDVKTYPKLFETATKLEGFVEYTGIHASGIIVCDKPIYEIVPIMRHSRDATISTQWDLETCEKAGLVKFDLLGLETLTVIKRIEDLILARHNKSVNINNIDYNVKAVYDLFCAGDTEGVFQCYSEGMKRLIKEVQPDCFEDIVASIALFRPGPINSGILKQFINRKHGREKVTYPHEDLKEIMVSTYGTMVYQEQIMRLASVLAGFSLNEADELRKAVGKKKPELLAEIKSRFLKGCKETNRIDQVTANFYWDQIDKFGEYGFNKSHSVSYAYLSYYTAYLKVFYPIEFFAANLTQEIGNTDKLKAFIVDARNHSIEIIRPDIVLSKYDFTIEEKNIRIGLGAIKGSNRDISSNKFYDQFNSDLITYLSIIEPVLKKDSFCSYVMGGAFDSFNSNRNYLLLNAKDILDNALIKRENKLEGNTSLFDENDSVFSHKTYNEESYKESTVEELKWERDVFGFYVSGHPLKFDIAKYIAGYKNISQLEDIKSGSIIKIIGIVSSIDIKSIKNGPNKGQKYCPFILEDVTGTLNCTLYAKKYNILYPKLKDADDKALIIVLNGRLSNSDNIITFSLYDVQTFDEYLNDMSEYCFSISSKKEYDFESMNKLFINNPGSCPVSFIIDNQIKYKTNLSICNISTLVKDVEKLF